jgi:hypothetical protein
MRIQRNPPVQAKQYVQAVANPLLRLLNIRVSMRCTSEVVENITYFGIIDAKVNIIFFTAIYDFAKLIMIFLCYLVHRKIKYEFYLKTNLGNERDYVVDLISTMERGFITYNKETLFINDEMKMIIIDKENWRGAL